MGGSPAGLTGRGCCGCRGRSASRAGRCPRITSSLDASGRADRHRDIGSVPAGLSSCPIGSGLPGICCCCFFCRRHAMASGGLGGCPVRTLWRPSVRYRFVRGRRERPHRLLRSAVCGSAAGDRGAGDQPEGAPATQSSRTPYSATRTPPTTATAGPCAARPRHRSLLVSFWILKREARKTLRAGAPSRNRTVYLLLAMRSSSGWWRRIGSDYRRSEVYRWLGKSV